MLLHLKGILCAEVIRPRVSYPQNDDTLSRNSLMYTVEFKTAKLLSAAEHL